MKCPESVIKATFLYLDRMEKEGNLIVTPEDIKDIICDVEKNFDKYLSSANKYEKQKNELPFPEIPQFHVVSKHLIAGANYINEKGSINIVDEKKIVSIRTNYDVLPSLEVFNVDNAVDVDLEQKVLSSIYLKEDALDIAMLGTDIDGKVDNAVLNHIESYLEEIHANTEILDSNEKKELAKLILGCSLVLAKNDYMSSNGNIPLDYRLVLDDNNIDSIKESIKENTKLDNTMEREFVDIKNLLEHIKTEVSKDYLKFISSIPTLRTTNHKELLNSFSQRYNSENNSQFIKGISSAKNMQFELNVTPKDNHFYCIVNTKSKKDSFKKLIQLETNQRYLTDDLNEKKVRPIIPSSIIIDLSDSKIKMNIEFDNKEVDLIKQCSERTDREFFYHSNIADGRIQIEVIDESDSKPKGGGATVMREIAKNAQNIITGTGTGITGKAKSIVGQLANTGSIDNIEELEKQYTELCGVFEIKSPFVRALSTLIRSDSDTARYFNDAVAETIELVSKNKNSNLNKSFEVFTKGIIQRSAKIGLVVEDINIFDAYKSTKSILFGLSKDKEVLRGNIRGGKELIEHCLFSSNNTLLKEVAGIQAGILTSLINSQTDTNISITTRENLTGKKENMNFVDNSKYNSVSEKIYSEDGDVSDIFMKNNLSAKITKEYLSKTAEKNYTTQLYTFLKTNFDFFVEAFKQKDIVGMKNLELVAKEANQSAKDFIYNTSKKGTSTDDGVLSLFSSYLSNNGELDEKTLATLNEENLSSFNACLKVFQEEFLDKYIGNEEQIMEDTEKEIETEDDTQEIAYEMNYYLPEELYNLYGESVSIEAFVDFKEAYPYKKDNGNKIPFFVPTVFMKEQWKDFIAKPVKYKTSLTNSEMKDIIDNFSSIGKEELLKKSIIEDKEKAVVVSSRRIASVFNLYDIVNSTKDRDDNTNPLLILAVSTPELSEAVRNINEDFLKEQNINIKIVKSDDIATEIDKANSKQLQYTLVSSYIPIARGLSLAETDRTIVTNPITKSGDGIQLLARGINPSKNILDTNIHLHDGGENIELSIKYGAEASEIKDFLSNVESYIKFDNGSLLISDNNNGLESYANYIATTEICSIDRTYTDKINKELQESNKVYKGFTSGEYADTKKTMHDSLIVMTKPYESLLIEQNNSGELDIDNFSSPSS